MTNASTSSTLDYNAWVTTDTGERIAQSSAESTIRSMVELLNVQAGDNVLESGTGSGFSAALLAQQVGPTGRVVSVDVDSVLVNRARQLHQQAGHHQVEVHTADGYQGWADSAPYDRVIGWATPHVLPASWLSQACDDATIVTPVKVADIAVANAILRCKSHSRTPTAAAVTPGSFIEMAAEPLRELGLPVRYVDAVDRSSQPPGWISGRDLHGKPDHAARLLDLILTGTPEAGFLTDNHDHQAFTGFLLATTPRPASLGGLHGLGLGIATNGSAAVVLTNGALLQAGDSQAADELRDLHHRWERDDKPGYPTLQPTCHPAAGGWTVRLSPR